MAKEPSAHESPAVEVGEYAKWTLSTIRARRRACCVAIGLVACTILVGGWAFWQYRRPAADGLALWEKAQRDLRAGRYLQVERDLKQASRLRAPTPFDWFLRAELADLHDRPDEAVADLARVPDHHALGAHARMLTGQIERKRHRVRLAEAAFLRALAIDPSLVQVHRELIYIYGMQLRRPELSREFLALKKARAFTFQNAFHWCLLRNNSWEPREAIAELSKYVAADPLDRWSRLALAENYRRMGLDGEAESVLSSLPPEDNEANALRIQIALDRHDDERAEKLLAHTPADDPVLARVRGRRALGRRDAQSAVRYFQIAYAADPSNRETIFGLLSAWELLGNEQEAKPLRARARNLDRLNTLVLQAAKPQAPEDAVLMRDLGATCAALDRDEEARAWFELAIARDPLDSSAQQALFRLGDSGQNGGEADTKSREEPPVPKSSFW